MTTTYIEKLTDFALDCSAFDIPAEIREKATHFCWTRLASRWPIGASHSSPFRQRRRTHGRQGRCTAIGYPRPYVAEGAAQLNSTAIHGSDSDATHVPSIMHTPAWSDPSHSPSLKKMVQAVPSSSRQWRSAQRF